MPKLIFCGRSWMVGSDDFVFPGFRGFVVNAGIAIWIPLVFKLGSDDCGNGVKEYLMVSFVLHCFNAVLCLLLAYHSSKGSIFETSKRALVPTVLVLLCITTLIIIGVSIWGLLELYKHDACTDHPEDRHWLLATVITQLVLIGCVMCMFMLDYNFSHQYTDPAESEGNIDEYNKLWKSRCKKAFCFVGADDELFDEIAKVLSGVFSGLDLVASDIAAGVALLRAKQISAMKSAQIAAKLRDPTTTMKALGHPDINLSHEARPIEKLSKQAEEDLLILHQYSAYFMGAYGWPMHVYAHPLTCLPRMCSQCCKGLPSKKVVSQDNCCKCNTAAWLSETKAGKASLKHASWTSKLDRPAFYICVDNEAQSVIVGIRGTLSPEDCLTDANADAMPFGEDCVEGGLCHKGIGLAARGVRRAIDKEGLLEEAFEKNSGYRLVIIGHSLGAGTAALLAIELKPKYPDLLGLAYSPPGGLMNTVLCDFSKTFILALGLGQDLVPRASIKTVRNFRDRMLESLSASNAPKCSVLGCCCCISADKQAEKWLKLDSNNTEKTKEVGEPYDESSKLVCNYLSSISSICEPTVDLYPPSRYIHIMRVGYKGHEEVLHPISLNVVDLMEEGILASVSMVLDHVPHNVLHAINKTVDPDRRFDLDGFGIPSSYINPLRTDFSVPIQTE
eukprot:TRINITY_DN8994_c0_g2_i1.p1 TRINITY_DN8994_c0_g2~~TRINITY_DN8994_c0_g2_i1.p1  ORF type:complete len:674 (+),score=117.83 TRINITY_DN8994_c0_g2_i1:55-2076(+)